jgi:hypothetical protein
MPSSLLLSSQGKVMDFLARVVIEERSLHILFDTNLDMLINDARMFKRDRVLKGQVTRGPCDKLNHHAWLSGSFCREGA